MSRSLMYRQPFAALAIAVCLFPVGIGVVPAQDFRVDTDVFLGDESQTFSEHLSLFHGHLVYDFTVKGPEEITILDFSKGIVTLLDVKRRVRTDLKTAELLDFSAHIKAIGKSNHADDLVAPKFEVTFDPDADSLTLASRKITYKAKATKPTDPTVASRYREFTDWYARLNSMRPPNPPHFGRLELNRELANRGLMPEEIERTIVLGRLFAKPEKARSQHLVNMTISGTDRNRIEKAGGYLVDFTRVNPAEYMQPAAVATR